MSVAPDLEANVQALRTDMLAALRQRKVAWEAALETRLRSDLNALVASEMATLRLGDDDRRTFAERSERIQAHVTQLAGELAQLREQLLAMGTVELREEVDRLSLSVNAERAETATRADLVALEDHVGNELRAIQSDVQSRLAMLDAVVNAVDDAAANLDARLVERLTGVAKKAASTALAPVRSDLRAVHDEVAATQRSIRELRRRVRAFLPPAAPATGSVASKRAASRTLSSLGKGSPT